MPQKTYEERRYMVLVVNDRTKLRVEMLQTVATHKEALTVKSKLNHDRPKHVRVVIEER